MEFNPNEHLPSRSPHTTTNASLKNPLGPTGWDKSLFKVESPSELESVQMELIHEKIEIPPLVACISRPRLKTLLEQSLASCTSTILSGRSGTGKTTLAIDFAKSSGRLIAWYKVDAPDNELRIFFQYLITSICRQRRTFASQSLMRLIQSASGAQLPLLAEAFVYELERQPGDPLLIVIEDLHLVCDAEWLVAVFRRLLPLLPSDVHLLITSRTMPPAPLWRMRSKQTLSVIDEETLAFTRDEAVTLFESLGLSPEQASIALDHSHGRAAALSSLAATLHLAERKQVRDKSLGAGTRKRVT
jgi:LuxR family transcriptional regulator, maltose regulon positive regulatory protein